MILTTIIIFLLVLGVIVFFHELGHFLVAKFYGVKVDEFGLGFPPKICGFKKGETEYTLNLIPLGGFVKIVGEDGGDKNDPRSFSSKSVGQRFQIISAGVIMNVILAFIIFSAVFMVGFPQNKANEAIIGDVLEKTPAFEAGLEIGDKIIKIDEKDIKTIQELQNTVKEKLGEKITLTIVRVDKTITKELIPRKEHPEKEGAMGVILVSSEVISYPPLEAIIEGFKYTIFVATFIVSAFWGVLTDLVKTGATSVEISGPVGIATMTQQAASLGIVNVLFFIALISINLAIINILPFPALDGGRLLFLVVEKIKGSPLNQEWEARANNFGFALLMLLMVVVTFKDLMRIDILGKISGLFG